MPSMRGKLHFRGSGGSESAVIDECAAANGTTATAPPPYPAHQRQRQSSRPRRPARLPTSPRVGVPRFAVLRDRSGERRDGSTPDHGDGEWLAALGTGPKPRPGTPRVAGGATVLPLESHEPPPEPATATGGVMRRRSRRTRHGCSLAIARALAYGRRSNPRRRRLYARADGSSTTRTTDAGEMATSGPKCAGRGRATL